MKIIKTIKCSKGDWKKIKKTAGELGGISNEGQDDLFHFDYMIGESFTVVNALIYDGYSQWVPEHESTQADWDVPEGSVVKITAYDKNNSVDNNDDDFGLSVTYPNGSVGKLDMSVRNIFDLIYHKHLIKFQG